MLEFNARRVGVLDVIGATRRQEKRVQRAVLGVLVQKTARRLVAGRAHAEKRGYVGMIEFGRDAHLETKIVANFRRHAGAVVFGERFHVDGARHFAVLDSDRFGEVGFSVETRAEIARETHVDAGEFERAELLFERHIGGISKHVVDDAEIVVRRTNEILHRRGGGTTRRRSQRRRAFSAAAVARIPRLSTVASKQEADDEYEKSGSSENGSEIYQEIL